MNDLCDWLISSELGKYIINYEKELYKQLLNNITGCYAIQIGSPKINLLYYASQIKNKTIINHNSATFPFASNSIDLILCNHSLEFNHNIERSLNEYKRILVPQGKLIITCFNSTSLLNITKRKNKILKNVSFIKLEYIKQKLINLNFYIEQGSFFSYIPLLSDNIIKKMQWLNLLGNRFFPSMSNAYTILNYKENNIN